MDWPRLAPFERVRLGGHYATPLVHKVGVKQLIVVWTCEKELRKLIVVWTYEYVHENMCVCVFMCVCTCGLRSGEWGEIHTYVCRRTSRTGCVRSVRPDLGRVQSTYISTSP